MYLAPFIQGNGAKVLRAHLRAMTNGDIAAVGRRASQLRVPVLSSMTSPWRFMPEENPSEAASVIARTLVA